MLWIQSKRSRSPLYYINLHEIGDGESIYKTVRLLDACRKKRNIATYDAAGTITEAEVKDILEIAKDLVKEAEDWIRKNYPEYGL